MTTFGEALRRLMNERDQTLGRLAELTKYDKGYLSKVMNGRRPVTDEIARRCDVALDARGDLIAAAHLDVAAARDSRPWETADLIQRLQAADASPHTVERIEATVFELCCEYPFRDAVELRTESQEWLRHIATLLRKPIGLHQHRELLVSAGWLALLIGCVEYDLGMRSGAEATRVAARQLGTEAGHSEILAWSHEMSAWFALTQGRYRSVLTAARAGREADSTHSVTVQLLAQEAKALARLGDLDGVRAVLEHGQRFLSSLPRPERPEHHFAVDPDKWVFYAMDAYRLAGDDQLAATYAQEVITTGTLPDGGERAPMRMAEARLTLGVVAARTGQLEEATSAGNLALESARRSLPSLLMVAGELDSVLQERYSDDRAVRVFRSRLREIQ
jgi:transcriptional regulator with XRE-family HTH domain